MWIFWRFSKMKLISEVKGHEGECYPTWINKNMVSARLNGYISGSFKKVRYICGIKFFIGDEFHGVISGKTVQNFPTN